MLSQQVSWSPRVIIHHGLTCVFILWLIAIDIDDNFAQGAMVYTTTAMNYHKELYHVRGGKKAIRETRLVQLYIFSIYIYIFIYVCNIFFGSATLIILHWSSAEDWAHCEATRLRSCFSHLHRLTYKSELSRSGGLDWTLLSLKPWPTALAGMELWGSWRSSISNFAPLSEP